MRATIQAQTGNAATLKTREHGEQLIAHLQHAMHALRDMLEKEIELVRAGRLSEVARLEPSKAELARIFTTDAAVVKANAAFLKRELPVLFEKLASWHAALQKVVQVNLTVLATAHAVSEGIIRGVASELARKAAPSTYGRSSRPGVPQSGQVQPLAVSRTL